MKWTSIENVLYSTVLASSATALAVCESQSDSSLTRAKMLFDGRTASNTFYSAICQAFLRRSVPVPENPDQDWRLKVLCLI